MLKLEGPRARAERTRRSNAASSSIVLACHGEAFFHGRHRPIELPLVDGAQDLSHLRAGRHSDGEQVAAEQHWLRRRVLNAKLACPLEKPVHGGAVEAAAAA